MSHQKCHAQLCELLHTHVTRINRASEYLAEIKTAIAENRLEQLQQTLAHPDFAVNDIEHLEQQRHQLLSSYGFSEGSEGFEQCVAWCDDEQGHVNELYQQLIQGLVKLQHSIQANNLLVSKGRDRVRRSLGILSGLGAAGNCKTYSSDGKTTNPTGQRDIAIV
ncbi:MAG: flagellar protein FlgN [Gammaproteobacteria bacterium]|nr:flagellar protein FlgN [Gammaproteobacteria bacterium]